MSAIYRMIEDSAWLKLAGEFEDARGFIKINSDSFFASRRCYSMSQDFKPNFDLYDTCDKILEVVASKGIKDFSPDERKDLRTMIEKLECIYSQSRNDELDRILDAWESSMFLLKDRKNPMHQLRKLDKYLDECSQPTIPKKSSVNKLIDTENALPSTSLSHKDWLFSCDWLNSTDEPSSLKL